MAGRRSSEHRIRRVATSSSRARTSSTPTRHWRKHTIYLVSSVFILIPLLCAHTLSAPHANMSSRKQRRKMTHVLVAVSSDIPAALICNETLPVPSDYEDSDDGKMSAEFVEANSTSNAATVTCTPPISAASREFMPGVFQSISLFAEDFGGLTPEGQGVDPLLRIVNSPSRSLRRRADVGMPRFAHSGRPGSRLNHEVWNARFNELCNFRARYGHCKVPSGWNENKALANWVRRCRQEYRMTEEGTCFSMTPERIAMLNSINFEWPSTPEKTRKISKAQGQWNERCIELFQFKTRYGHCNVPEGWKDNPRLAQWVIDQRQEYHRYLAKQRSTMSQERHQRLTALGFLWHRSDNAGELYPAPSPIPKHRLLTPSPSSAGSANGMASRRSDIEQSTYRKKTDDATELLSFDEGFNELIAYKEKHGTFDVPVDAGELYSWVQRQIIPYIHKYMGEPSSMKDSSFRKLQQIGTFGSLNAKERKWYLMYDELRKYIADHGHMDGIGAVNDSLRTWCYTQRYVLKQILWNDSNCTEEMIAKIKARSAKLNA